MKNLVALKNVSNRKWMDLRFRYKTLMQITKRSGCKKIIMAEVVCLTSRNVCSNVNSWKLGRKPRVFQLAGRNCQGAGMRLSPNKSIGQKMFKLLKPTGRNSKKN